MDYELASSALFVLNPARALLACSVQLLNAHVFLRYIMLVR